MGRLHALVLKILEHFVDAVLLIFLLAISFISVAPTSGHAQDTVAWTFQGRVYDGEVGDESRPLPGVTLLVYGANSPYPTDGALIASTTTNDQGWYGLAVPAGYEYYFIRRANLPGYESVGATTVGGKVRTNDWIEYVIPLDERTLTGNKFWVKGPAQPPSFEKPQITEVHPAEGHCSSEIVLTVFGVNFDSGSSVRIPEGIITHYTRFINPNKLMVGISVGDDAPAGPRPVEVTVPERGKAILEHGFTVIRPDTGSTIHQPDTSGPQPVPEGHPDWALVELNSKIVERGRLLIIHTLVANVGDAPAPEVIVLASSQTTDWFTEAIVPELDNGTSTEILLNLEIPDEVRGERHRLVVSIDPANDIAEKSEDNNRKTIDVVMEPLARPNLIPLILTVTVVVVLTLSTTFTIRRSIRIRRRKEWQQKSKEEKPPKECQPCTYYCRKIEIELGLALRNITYLSFSVYDPVSGKQSRERQFKGELVDGLNRVVTAHRRGQKSEKLQEQVIPLAQGILQKVAEWLHDEPVPCDVSLDGHIEGGKVTCQFILYHCKRRGTVNVWEEKDKWKRSIKEERDVSVGTLRGVDPTEPAMSEKRTPELTQLLVQFIKKV